MGRAVALLLLGACYGASPSPGAPCSASGACPRDQTCVAGVCETGGGPGLDGGDDGAPVLVDGEPSGAVQGWGPAVVVLHSGKPERDPAVSESEGEEAIYFTTPRNGGEDLFVSRAGDIDALPSQVNTSAHDEHSPHPVVGGVLGLAQLYFTSNRDGGGYDVYTASQIFQNTWSAPVRDANLSSSDDDLDVALSPDGLTAIVARADGLCYRHTRATTGASWGPGAALHELPAGCAGPALAADGTLYFHLPQRGLWVRLPGDVARPLPELNTTGTEQDPFISADAKTIWFSRADVIVKSTRP